MAFEALEGQEFINLTTYRRSGVPVVTPVWFARNGDRLYVMTGTGSGKVKRIRHTPAVDVGASDRSGKPLGPTEPAAARILDDVEARRADELLNTKYGLMKRMFDAAGVVRRLQRTFLEIGPRGDDNPGPAST